MKILIYNADVVFNSSDGRHLDIAIEEIKKGNEIFVLHCDKSLGICVANAGCNALFCKLCRFCQKEDMRYLKGLPYEEHNIEEYVSMIDTTRLPIFDYHTADELRALEYKNIEIGIGALSSYITLTRNLNPMIDSESKPYFDDILRSEIITTEVLEILQNMHNFDMMVFQNGRGAQFKPFLNFCQNRNIPFICTEWIKRDEQYYINHFWCDSAHSYKAYAEKYEKFWNESKDTAEEREKIARSFFENRRYGKFAGDKIYTKKQKQGLLPKDWNNNIENIVIFNSSQDEYAAISKEFDREALFMSQLSGIKRIVEHYKDDKSKHFTLRIHPNLIGIPYSYHQSLYELSYTNLSIIPADSNVSSYSLMDAADKVIVFGSTMGIESAYWGKPVINLAGIVYKSFNVVHMPETEEQLWNMIDNKNLACLRNDKILQYGYFIMSLRHEKTKHINNDIYEAKFMGYDISCANYQKIFGSNYLYALVWKILTKLRYKYPAKYNVIYNKEA